MIILTKEGQKDQLTKVKLPKCEPCLAIKETRKPFRKALKMSSPLELIHADICKPMNVKIYLRVMQPS